MKNIETDLNLNTMLEDLEVELQIAERDPQNETDWDRQYGILLSKNDVERIVYLLEELKEFKNNK